MTIKNITVNTPNNSDLYFIKEVISSTKYDDYLFVTDEAYASSKVAKIDAESYQTILEKSHNVADTDWDSIYGVTADQTHVWIISTNGRIYQLDHNLNFIRKSSAILEVIATERGFLANDENYLYVADVKISGTRNIRIIDKLDFSILASIPDYKFLGIAVDDNYIYATAENKIHIFNKTTPYSLIYTIERVNNPQGIAVDDDYIYITENDYSLSQNKVVIFNKSDRSVLLDFGGDGSQDTYFRRVYGIDIDDNYIYIVDCDNYKLKRWSKNSMTVEDPPTYDSSIGTVSSSSFGNFNYPRCVAFLRVSTNDYIQAPIAETTHVGVLRYAPTESGTYQGEVYANASALKQYRKFPVSLTVLNVLTVDVFVSITDPSDDPDYAGWFQVGKGLPVIGTSFGLLESDVPVGTNIWVMVKDSVNAGVYDIHTAHVYATMSLLTYPDHAEIDETLTVSGKANCSQVKITFTSTSGEVSYVVSVVDGAYSKADCALSTVDGFVPFDDITIKVEDNNDALSFVTVVDALVIVPTMEFDTPIELVAGVQKPVTGTSNSIGQRVELESRLSDQDPEDSWTTEGFATVDEFGVWSINVTVASASTRDFRLIDYELDPAICSAQVDDVVVASGVTHFQSITSTMEFGDHANLDGSEFQNIKTTMEFGDHANLEGGEFQSIKTTIIIEDYIP